MSPNQDDLDITPGTNVIHFMRNQNLTWTDVLKELIDNAIDQGATRIALSYTPGKRGVFCIGPDHVKGGTIRGKSQSVKTRAFE